MRTNRSLPLWALWNSLAATAYIVMVATVFAFRFFGIEDKKVFAPMVAMLLLVFSVLVMGTVLLLPPLRLYLDGQKTEGVRLLLFTGMWMGIFMILTITVMSLV